LINAANLSADQISAIEQRIQELFGATLSPNGDAVGISFSFTGKADSSLTIFSNASWYMNLWGSPFGAETLLLSPRIYWNNMQPYAPYGTAAFAGGVAAHELAHDLFGSPLFGTGDLKYDSSAPNMMMFDNAPDLAQLDAISNPGSELWQFTPDQVASLYSKCKSRHSVGGRHGGGRRDGWNPITHQGGSMWHGLWTCTYYWNDGWHARDCMRVI
jgi:hypothetical protein